MSHSGYVEPTNYTMARRLAADLFGYVIRKDTVWGVIKVYRKGISQADLREGTNVYETREDDWQDAWDTMKSLWNADRRIEQAQEEARQDVCD